MLSGQKVKKGEFSWKWIALFLLLMWMMTLLCRFVSQHGIARVEICRVERRSISGEEERYAQCVPSRAVYTDGGGRRYVYCLEERKSILGIILVAEKRYVEVLAEDGDFAALKEGAVTVMDEIISSSSRELKEGMLVKAG